MKILKKNTIGSGAQSQGLSVYSVSVHEWEIVFSRENHTQYLVQEFLYDNYISQRKET